MFWPLQRAAGAQERSRKHGCGIPQGERPTEVITSGRQHHMAINGQGLGKHGMFAPSLQGT